jgi:hypothetical protein
LHWAAFTSHFTGVFLFWTFGSWFRTAYTTHHMAFLAVLIRSLAFIGSSIQHYWAAFCSIYIAYIREEV